MYSHHTAIDAKFGGVNDWLASCVGDIETSRPLAIAMNQAPSNEALKVFLLICAFEIIYSHYTKQKQKKIITFVPLDAVVKVREAMSEAGAGKIGDYSLCSFKTQGVGSFLGGKSTKPTVGIAGQIEFVDECKLEMVTSKQALPKVIAALKQSHPYEEVAFDVRQFDFVCIYQVFESFLIYVVD